MNNQCDIYLEIFRNHFAKRDHHLSEARCNELWEKINQPQLTSPPYVVRAKTKLLLALVVQLEALLPAVESYSEEVERFSPLCRQLSW